MKITAIDIAVVDVPYIGPVRAVGWANPPFVVVQVRTDDGLVGLGEAWGVAKTVVEQTAETFLGTDPLTLPLQTCDRPFQSALYDLVGQALGVPVWRLIGDQHRERVPVAYWSCHMPPEATAREAEQAVAKGFTGTQTQGALLGRRSPSVELISKAAGPDYAILFDPNTEFRHVCHGGQAGPRNGAI